MKNKFFPRLGLMLVAAFAATSVQAERISKEQCVGFESDRFLTQGSVVVTQADLDAFLRDHVPEADRPGVLEHPERIGRILDNLLRTYHLAELALAEDGLVDEEALAWLHYRLNNDLATLYRDHHVDKAELDSYEDSAREMYLTRPEDFRHDPTIDFLHILIADEEGRSETDIMRKALEVHDRLAAGEDFETVAREVSDDPSVSDNDGLLSDVKPTEIVPQLAAILQETPPGELAAPVRSRFGWHITMLVRVNEGEEMSWEEARPLAERRARENHRSRVVERLFRSFHDAPAEFAEGAVATLLARYGVTDDGEVTADGIGSAMDSE